MSLPLLRRITRLRRLVLVARVLVFGTVAMFVASAFAKRLYFDIIGHPLLPDFIAHYTGGVLAGKPELYSIEAQATWERTTLGDPDFMNLYISPPYVAWIYWPFARLPLNYAMVAWAAVIAACFVAIYKLLRSDIDTPKESQRRLFVLFALAFQPVVEVVTSGQDTCLTGLIWALGIHFSLRRKDLASGLAFGLGAIKPQLFVLPFLYLGLKKRWAALAGMVLTGSAWIALGLATGGPASFRRWVGILQSPEYLELTRKGRIWKMHSIVAMVEGLVPASLDSAARVVGNLAAIVIGVLTLRAAHAMPDPRRAWSLLVVATVLCSPHLFSYDLALLVIPALLLLPERWPRSTVYAILSINVLVWLSSIRAESFSEKRWPLSIIAMSVTPIAILVVWRDLARLHRRRA